MIFNEYTLVPKDPFVEQACNTLITVTQSLIAPMYLFIDDYVALIRYLRCVQLRYVSGLGSADYTSTRV